MKWTDFQYLLAVYEGGTITDAAKKLGVNPTTVSRRLNVIEEQSGVRFLHRQRDQITLTASGEELIETAKEMDVLVNQLSAKIDGMDNKLGGTVRITSISSLFSLWMPDLKNFNSNYTDITLELLSSYAMANLTKREADIAIRIAASVPEHMIGSQHAKVFYAVYGSAELFSEYNSNNYADYLWVSWDLGITRATDNYLEKNINCAKVSLRIDRIEAMKDALECGMGISIMPCFIGDQSEKLVRIGDYFEGGHFLWVLTHPDLRTTARITALMKYFRELIARDKDLFEGKKPQT